MLQLAKIDCKKTVQLVKDLLNDDKGKFEENLIMIRMNEAADFEESQYDYLEAFFKKMGLPGLSAAEILRVETDLKSIEPRADNFNKLLSKTESYDNKMAVSASDLLC